MYRMYANFLTQDLLNFKLIVQSKLCDKIFEGFKLQYYGILKHLMNTEVNFNL